MQMSLQASYVAESAKCSEKPIAKLLTFILQAVTTDSRVTVKRVILEVA